MGVVLACCVLGMRAYVHSYARSIIFNTEHVA